MTYQKKEYQAYANATQTVAPVKQIVMLYDGALRFMQRAKEAVESKRIEDRYHLLVKANNVITGLQSCLDFEKGGEMARILYSFYSTIETRILSIHRSNSVETCNEVIAELEKMRNVWHEIDQNEISNAMAAPADQLSERPVMQDKDQNFTLSA